MNTAQERASAMLVGLPWRVYPIPDGTISVIDRPHVGNCYRGIELVTVRLYSSAIRFVMPTTLEDGELLQATLSFMASVTGSGPLVRIAMDNTTNSAQIATYAAYAGRTRTTTTIDHTVTDGLNQILVTSLFDDITGNLGTIASGSGVTFFLDGRSPTDKDRSAELTSYEVDALASAELAFLTV